MPIFPFMGSIYAYFYDIIYAWDIGFRVCCFPLVPKPILSKNSSSFANEKSDYPQNLPKVKLFTIGGGTVRSNPNLSPNGKKLPQYS